MLLGSLAFEPLWTYYCQIVAALQWLGYAVLQRLLLLTPVGGLRIRRSAYLYIARLLRLLSLSLSRGDAADI